MNTRESTLVDTHSYHKTNLDNNPLLGASPSASSNTFLWGSRVQVPLPSDGLEGESIHPEDIPRMVLEPWDVQMLLAYILHSLTPC